MAGNAQHGVSQPIDGYLSGCGDSGHVQQLDDSRADRCDDEQMARIDIDRHAHSTRAYVGFDNDSADFFYYYVCDLPYDLLASFRYLAQGNCRASDVIEHDVTFCMGKASWFVVLSRAAEVPARIAFQTLRSPDKKFPSPEIRVRLVR